MKDFIIILVIILLITCSSIFMYHYYNDTKDEFTAILENMSEDLKNGTIQEEKVKTLTDLWNEKENLLIVFQAHDDIDEIEEALFDCINLYKENDKEMFELSKSKTLSELEDLAKRECLNLVNIF